MVASTLITDYFSEGLHSARPATPNIPTGATAIYYEIDTTNTFAWSGSAWAQINGGGGGLTAPTVVQTALNAGAAVSSATFASAPTSGNLLVAIIDAPSLSGGSINTAAGWQLGLPTDAGGINFGGFFYRFAGAAEPTTQQPLAATQASCICIFEVANAALTKPVFADASSTSGPISADAYGTGGLIIGAAVNETLTPLPTSITGATAGASATGTTNSIRAFTKTATTKGLAANVITAAYAATSHIKMMAAYLGAG